MSTYFVMPDEIAEKHGFEFGSDANSGLSFDKPFKTLEHAIAIVTANAPQNKDMIFIVGGDENV